MKVNLLIIIFLLLYGFASSQYAIDQSVTVKNLSGLTIKYPWAGGLNNAQFSEVDLNGDGIQDLFIFDRTGDKVYTFLNGGTINTVDYIYAPEFENNFPFLENWVLLVDYNCDNVQDIFTFTNNPATGIRVFSGFFDMNNTIQFVLQDSLLEYSQQSFDVNLYVSSADIPAVVDVNNDGDKDVLTFQQAGGYVMYFENLSQETGSGCNGLSYKLQDDCWGDFFESGFRREDSLNVPCPFFKVPRKNNEVLGTMSGIEQLRHTGSTLLAFDNDGDNDLELITGDISFTNLVYLVNGGTPDDAHMISQDTLFPSYDLSANIFVFPAPFLADINNDGLKDLIVSSNWQGSENYNCVWYYKNEGNSITADFNYQTNTFLVDEMIDVGEGSQPVFFDVDNDGLQDMLIGNYGYFDTTAVNNYVGEIAYFINIGDATHPAFQLITNDYENLSSLNVLFIRPAFGDLDGDGDEDMITGRNDGTLLYLQNIATPGNAADFIFMAENYGGIDVGNFSTPQVVDVNRDGLQDLLIGEKDGNLNYYQNTGTSTTPIFILTNSFFGGVDVRQQGYLTGYSSPYLCELDSLGEYTLLVGSERGFIFRYTNIENNLNGTFIKADSIYSGIRMGLRSSPSGADLDNDGIIELLVGNYRGGVSYYNEALNVAVEPLVSDVQVAIFPNPASDNFHISIPQEMMGTALTMSLINCFGEKVLIKKYKLSINNFNIGLQDVPSGVYLLQLCTSYHQSIVKVIIIH
jgi:hypothetical protein